MGMRVWTGSRGALMGALLVALALGGGCRSSIVTSTAVYRYFVQPAPDDLWSRKIRGWQERERADQPAPAPVAKSGAATAPADGEALDLRVKYNAFRAERKRALARELAEWVQAQAPAHYVEDGAVDHWATLEETFRKGGEDCDGLELLAFRLLRDLGFPEEEVYRAIVVRPSDGQHHMVTLWFEDPSDPWVIDPTGAMTSGLPRMSEVPGWVPLKIFTETRDFTVRTGVDTASR